eukprot:CAMPEP_0117795614 /NCGR_PEP_ID=MMETSP0948-20121206/11422_1 /TAXON_ID=44440 /ORGANISM="Chattonella subsalsa, Strain CCMP2191" /LENGTH=237 /DNA_ID=CAMNT_0005626621 /DNA_START=194 /DNA_END=908 /DNA_ORIENTATION=+
MSQMKFIAITATMLLCLQILYLTAQQKHFGQWMKLVERGSSMSMNGNSLRTLSNSRSEAVDPDLSHFLANEDQLNHFRLLSTSSDTYSLFDFDNSYSYSNIYSYSLDTEDAKIYSYNSNYDNSYSYLYDDVNLSSGYQSFSYMLDGNDLSNEVASEEQSMGNSANSNTNIYSYSYSYSYSYDHIHDSLSNDNILNGYVSSDEVTPEEQVMGDSGNEQKNSSGDFKNDQPQASDGYTP